ncbi:MAG: cytochrome b/b6 domain-containing protein [Acidobacteria bacterium]|nr:cytochrome b/b6 domain-containing protein [Acidobacteriota bacterium]
MNNQGLYLYPLWLRIWHWLNAVLFVALLITGASMHFAQPGAPQLDFRTARLVHNTAGILLTLFYLIFLGGNVFGKNGRFYKLEAGDWTPGLVRQLRHYLLGIFRGEPHPYPHSAERKFNPLQKLSYAAVMYIAFPALALTGWVLFFPERLPERINFMTGTGIPGTAVFALFHSAIGYVLSLFMALHIYLGTTGETPFTLFRAMLTGYYNGRHAAGHGAPAAAPPASVPSSRV